jgi:DNA-binding response OmpR family regulator
MKTNESPSSPDAAAMKPAEKQVQLSLLLVDDDKELCGMMKEFFAEAGHRLDCEHDGRQGLASAVSEAYDLVILDVMLPIFDGFTVLQHLRRRNDLPVIVLTARPNQRDRIHGLNAGADDYLQKPFDPDELLARIRAVLRRTDPTSGSSSTDLTIGGIRINVATGEVWIEDSPVELTQMEYDLLRILLRSAGRVVSRDEIAMALYGRPSTQYDRILDVHISHLRKKLRGGRSLIRTVRGVGYVFARAT